MTGTALKQHADTPSGQMQRIIENGNTLDMLPKSMDMDLYKQGLFQAIDKLNIQTIKEVDGILLAVGELVKDGLLPNGKQAALISYGSKLVDGDWIKVYTPIRMVRGALDIAFDSGIENWHVDLIHKNDFLEYDVANPQATVFKPKRGGDRGEIEGYFGCAFLPNGQKNICVMWIDEILKRRNAVFAKFKPQKAAPWNGNKAKSVADMIASSTWTQHPREMMIKTGIHYQMKRIPMLKGSRLEQYYDRHLDREMKEMREVEFAPKDDTPAPDPAETAKKAQPRPPATQHDDILGQGASKSTIEGEVVTENPTPSADTGGGDGEVKLTPKQEREKQEAFNKVKKDEQGQGQGQGQGQVYSEINPPPPQQNDYGR